MKRRAGFWTYVIIPISPLVVFALLVLAAFGLARSSLASSPGYGVLPVGAQVVTSIAPSCFGYGPDGPVCADSGSSWMP
jgi:hypothetical protein